MTAIIAILTKLWPALLGAIVAAGGLLAGWARHKQAQAAEAQAAQKAAEVDTKVANVEKSAAEANAVAARVGAEAAKERTHVENAIAAGAPGESAERVRSDWCEC